MSFRDTLKSELIYQGILVKELSLKTGISKRTLDNYLREKSSTPPADIAVKIADALNVSVEYLVNGTTSNSKNSSENNYSGETRLIADKIEKLSKEKRTLIKNLIAILEQI